MAIRSTSTIERARVLLAEPLPHLRRAFAAAASLRADVDVVDNFPDARARLNSAGYDLVVANLRLGAYNGIHLAYVVGLSAGRARVVVHADAWDIVAVRDIRRANALYERTDRLVVTLPAYVGASLPPYDRRDPTRFDRRRAARGGRRAWDKVTPR